jgi:hypothetical protein
MLGYHVGPEDLDRLATVTRPIQAWYSTATQDMRGTPTLMIRIGTATARTGFGRCHLPGGEERICGIAGLARNSRTP